MTTILLIILFITQVVSFYLIALLYMKVSKFDQLENKQSKLMREMDDAITAYLAEIKDENEQLIEKLTVKMEQQEKEGALEEKLIDVEKDSAHTSSTTPVTMPQQTMRHYARKSYATIQQKTVPVDDDRGEEEVVEEVALDDRTRAIQLSAEGLSIEEIAKELDKGRTEIELILKFG